MSVERDDVIGAAIDLLFERGAKGVTMRAVADRLGVSVIPLYTKVGDKDALITAMAERLLGEVEVDVDARGGWTDQAERWAHAYRDRLRALPDRALLLHHGNRDVIVRATRPLLVALRRAGLPKDRSVRVCRLLTWLVSGHVIVESGVVALDGVLDPSADAVPGGEPSGVTVAETDELFAAHVRFVVDGLRREVEADARVV